MSAKLKYYRVVAEGYDSRIDIYHTPNEFLVEMDKLHQENPDAWLATDAFEAYGDDYRCIKTGEIWLEEIELFPLDVEEVWLTANGVLVIGSEDIQIDSQATIFDEVIELLKEWQPVASSKYPQMWKNPTYLSNVMTPAEIEAEFALQPGTVRKLVQRYPTAEGNWYRRPDQRTILIARSEAERRWSKK